MVANGPDTTAVKSSTRTPLSGPDMKISLTGLARDCRLFGVCCQPWEFREANAAPTLSSVELVRSHRPEPLVVAGCIGAVGLRGIAVDQRPQVHRVGGAAYLVLDREQRRTARKGDDVAKAVLVLVVFLGNQAALRQQAVGTREVRDVDLHVVAIEVRLRPVGLAELRYWSLPTL